MANFNTNQTRYFYVASQINANVAKDIAVGGSGAASKGDISLGATPDGKYLFFSYKNYDGKVVRSDLFSPKCISHLSKTVCTFEGDSVSVDPTATVLMKHTLSVDSSALDVTNTANYGMEVRAVITLSQFMSYDDADKIAFVAPVVLNADTNSAAKFAKTLAVSIKKNMPKSEFPYFKVVLGTTEITDAIVNEYSFNPISGTMSVKTGVIETLASNVATTVQLIQLPQKFILGKMSGEPVDISVEFKAEKDNASVICWGIDALSESSDVIPGAYKLAELEYFALGEIGDFNRGNEYNVEPAYGLTDYTKHYNLLNIEYFWAGEAENVQKSPRLLQVCAEATKTSDLVTALYDAVEAYVSGNGTASGSGGGQSA